MYALLDIGGTNLRVAIAEDLSADISIVSKIPTPEDPGVATDKIAEILADFDVRQAAVAIAGTVNKKKDELIASPNISSWIGFSFADTLSEKLNATVVLANDTDLGALGEAHHGAGEDAQVMGYLTVGTGVGGARIVEGEIDAGKYGFEPGHQIVEMSDFLEATEDGGLPPEGHIPGHLEYYLSGANIQRQTGKDAADVKDEKVWKLFQDRLAAALSNVSVMWSPDEIVLGGSMIMRNEFLSFAYLQKALERQLKVFPEVPTLQRAQLQDKAGLVGAQVYLSQQV